MSRFAVPDAPKIRQHVRYVTALDGTRLAWAESGAGPVLVKAANWLTHVEYERDSPVWKHWIQFLSTHCRFLRYDERGCGMSGWSGAAGLSVEQWADDLATVIGAANPQGPVTLLGISQGAVACIRYAIRHPERVSKMILYGGYARGALNRGTPMSQKAHQAMIDLTRTSWASDNPTFRQVFTSRFIPGGSLEQMQWFNELCLKTTSGEIAAALFEERGARRHHGLAEGRAHADARAPRPRRRSRPCRGRASARQRYRGRGVHRARLAQSRAARARTGLAALQGGGARVHAARCGTPTISRSPSFRPASGRCWR